MLEDENGNRRAVAMVQVTEEVATAETEEGTPSRCTSDGTDRTRGHLLVDTG